MEEAGIMTPKEIKEYLSDGEGGVDLDHLALYLSSLEDEIKELKSR